MKCILITGRTAEQGTSLELGKTSQEYHDAVALVFLNEEDMKELGVGENASIKVSTKFGSVVVRCKKGELDRGIAFIPLGPWASAIVGGDTEGTGMPKAKGIEAEVSKSEESPTTLDDLLKKMRGD